MRDIKSRPVNIMQRNVNEGVNVCAHCNDGRMHAIGISAP